MLVRHRPLGLLVAFAAMAAVVNLTQPVLAEEPSSPSGPVTSPSVTTAAGEPLVTVGSVTEETYTADGTTLVSTKTYTQATEDQTLGETFPLVRGSIEPLASGKGGSTSASGCRKVTVHNVEKTLLGFTAFKYNTSTSWCWTRSSQNIYNVKNGWSISNVNGTYYWKGQVNVQLLFYDYSTNNGYPRSAYKHYRQGRFENCVIKHGCILNFYPANTLRVYYNGTYAWSTN